MHYSFKTKLLRSFFRNFASTSILAILVIDTYKYINLVREEISISFFQARFKGYLGKYAPEYPVSDHESRFSLPSPYGNPAWGQIFFGNNAIPFVKWKSIVCEVNRLDKMCAYLNLKAGRKLVYPIGYVSKAKSLFRGNIHFITLNYSILNSPLSIS